MAAFFLTNRQSSRGCALSSILARGVTILPPDVQFHYWLINFTALNDSSVPSLTPPESDRQLMYQVWDQMSQARWGSQGLRRQSSDLVTKFFFSLRFFVTETKDPWFYRCTDDVFVNFEALPEFLRQLDRKYDPLKAFVALGNCIQAFVQGGSGWVLSRFAATRFVLQQDHLLRMTRNADDLAFTNWLRMFNVSLLPTNSGAILGRHFIGSDLTALLRRDISGIMTCRPVPRENGRCQTTLVPVRRIVFYHEMSPGRDLEDGLLTAQAMWSANPSLFWWQAESWPKLCVHKVPFDGVVM